MIELGQSLNSLILVESFNHTLHKIANGKDINLAIKLIMPPSLYEEENNNLSYFNTTLLILHVFKSLLNCICFGVSDCIGVDFGGDRQFLEYLGTSRRHFQLSFKSGRCQCVSALHSLFATITKDL